MKRVLLICFVLLIAGGSLSAQTSPTTRREYESLPSRIASQ